ncbi:14084_t:CDS:1 [Funneliformis caledonium]|uniref:14084_t:CDS:1 n=1 Tax=Funneliformis caledonium TaxID=1117310 RepID=A0A9N9H3D5_9GLOM|nr:14084_t:CDS:1 [Funneliformis caledonium]
MTFQSKYVESTSLVIDRDPESLKKLMEFICISLFKVFVSNNASLNNLRIKIDNSCGQFLFETCEIISHNPRFISDVEILNLEFDHLDLKLKLIQPFLESLPSFFSSIKHLNFCSNYYDETLSNNITNIIQSQKQLLSFSLSFTYNNVNALYPSKNLTSLHFFKCDFANLLSCEGHFGQKKLKSLSFMRCRGLTAQVFQQLFVIPTPFTPLKIKSLRVEDECSGIGLLIQEFGPYLEYLDLKLWEIADRKIALESIINYCDRIQYLCLAKFNHENIPQIYKLIAHNSQHLKYLTLHPTNVDGLQVSSSLLKGLGPTLPDSLEYLNLCLNVVPNDLYNFLCNIMHVGLKSLLAKNNHVCDVDTTFGVLKEFVMEKKIKHFAYHVNGYFNAKNLEHCKLDHLVNEFQHFAVMKRYGDLALGISDFDDNLY